jgi:hypothetical protein
VTRPRWTRRSKHPPRRRLKDLDTEVGRIKKKIRGLWIAVTVLIVVVVVLVALTAAPYLGFRMMGRGGAGFGPGGAGFQPGQGQGQGQGQFQPDDAGDNGGTSGTNP